MSIWSLTFWCCVNLVHIVKVVKIKILYKIVKDWWDRGLLDGKFFFFLFLKNKSKKHIDSGFMLNNLILYTFIHKNFKKKKEKKKRFASALCHIYTMNCRVISVTIAIYLYFILMKQIFLNFNPMYPKISPRVLISHQVP